MARLLSGSAVPRLSRPVGAVSIEYPTAPRHGRYAIPRARRNLGRMGSKAMVTPRREFSAATRRAAWLRCQGFCEGQFQLLGEGGLVRCNTPINLGNFHYDHIDPDYFSKDGSGELSNCQVLCKLCHRDKTKRDVKLIAKSKRIQDKRIKARKPKGRPMPGTKRSGWRKRMDGTVEKRHE